MFCMEIAEMSIVNAHFGGWRQVIMSVLGGDLLCPEFKIKYRYVSPEQARMSACWLLKHAVELVQMGAAVVEHGKRALSGATIFVDVEGKYAKFIDFCGDHVVVHDAENQLSVLINLRLVGIEVNPGPCGWANNDPKVVVIVKTNGKVDRLCPLCGKRVSRLSSARPWFHEDVEKEDLTFVVSERACFDRESRRSLKAIVRAESAPALVPKKMEQDVSRANSAPSSSTAVKSSEEKRACPQCHEDAPPNCSPAPEEKTAVVGGKDRDGGDDDLKLVAITRGDAICRSVNCAAQLNGLTVEAVCRDPRASVEYEVRTMIKKCGVDRRLPCHRGVQMTAESFLMQDITIKKRNNFVGGTVAIIVSTFVLTSVSVFMFLIKGYLESHLSQPLCVCLKKVGLSLIPILYKFGVKASLNSKHVNGIVIVVGCGICAMAAYGAFKATGFVHRILFRERTYVNVPSITASMVMDNFGGSLEEKIKNLPTLFRRHAGTLNLDSEYVCAAQEGCVFVAEIMLTEGLGFRLRATQ